MNDDECAKSNTEGFGHTPDRRAVYWAVRTPDWCWQSTVSFLHSASIAFVHCGNAARASASVWLVGAGVLCAADVVLGATDVVVVVVDVVVVVVVVLKGAGVGGAGVGLGVGSASTFGHDLHAHSHFSRK